uniref:DENN domain containing 1C n=1 Tax=Ovis aries TaxID=9940 RepID=A0AC11DLR9_SHEEP
ESTGPQDPWGKGPAGPALQGPWDPQPKGIPLPCSTGSSKQPTLPPCRKIPPSCGSSPQTSRTREPPSTAVQHFTFALTDLTGTRRFGFCRLRAGALSCLCILSHLPWFEVFYKLLNTVGDLLAQDQVSEVDELLLNLLQQPLPGTQASVGLDLGSGVRIASAQGLQSPVPGKNTSLSCFVAPDSGRLPSIPENRNLTELVVAVTDENILGLFAALLAERRVLLTSSKLSTVRRGSQGQGGTEASLSL